MAYSVSSNIHYYLLIYMKKVDCACMLRGFLKIEEICQRYVVELTVSLETKRDETLFIANN